MPNLKISQLTGGGAAQAADEFVVARSGGNNKVTGANVAAAATSVGTLTSLTVSGDLTVDTDTLFVDAANNRVGIGTNNPFNFGTGVTALTVSGAQNARIVLEDTSWEATGDGVGQIQFNDGGFNFVTSSRSGSGVTNSTTRLVLDASGNLGIGVTPQAWSTRALEIVGGVGISSVTGLDFTLNAYYNSGWLYRSTGAATRYEQASGQHRWYNAASGTAGNAITFTQAMTLDASGRLGIGTASPSAPLHVDAGSGGEYFRGAGNSGASRYFNITASTTTNAGDTHTLAATSATGVLAFSTAGSERARINQAGNFGIGTTSPSSTLHVEGLGNTVAARIFTSDNVANATADLLFGTTPGARTKAAIRMENTNTGNSAGSLTLWTNNGTSLLERWRISINGHLLAGADATYDIGASGATRPRDVFISGTFTGSKLSVSGVQDAISAVFSQDGESALLNLRNANSGAAAVAGVFLGTDASTSTLAIRAYSSGYTTSGLAVADSARVSANRPGGLTINAGDAAGVIRMAAGGTTERMRVKAEGQVRYVPLAAAPTTSVEDGDVYYDSGTNKLRVRAGGSWVDLH